MAPRDLAAAPGASAPPAEAANGAEAILAALPAAVLVIGADGAIAYANPAAEQFFATGASQLVGRLLAATLLPGSPLVPLVDQARGGGPVAAFGLAIETPRVRHAEVSARAAPLADGVGAVALALGQGSTALRFDRRPGGPPLLRSVAGIAALLAHEVKNPLSGIRGAAQLLEGNVRAEDRPLARLIRDEADRIAALIDRMGLFSDQAAPRGPVNIHEVLGRVRALAETGFARHVRLFERYDPSLPAVCGNRDQLIQVFLNLVKNAAEAVPAAGGEIVLATGYHHGVKVSAPGGAGAERLPVRVSVEDNGPGVAEELRPHLFEPFVASKPSGRGLGLALAAKIVAEHGGLIELGERPRGAAFHIFLPLASAAPGARP